MPGSPRRRGDRKRISAEYCSRGESTGIGIGRGGGAWRPASVLLALVHVTAALTAVSAELLAPNALGLRVAPGFGVSLHADATLADNIYAMTVNPRGQIVVTGRGYIRTLIDDNDDGVAESAVDFGGTTTGGMGLCFVGNDLLFVGDGALWRVPDADGDNRADGPAEQIIELPFSEYGGHAIRQGPDGALYLIAGNETKLAGWRGPIGPAGEHPIEGGALLRITPGDPGGSRVVAQGFRNPYAFDFNVDGEIFAYDSDVQGDELLPWYTPARLFHIAPGGHHGWRLDGSMRGWARPNYSPDTVEVLASVGRAAPAGATFYRHRQFPEAYRDGLFSVDWAYGQVQFAALEPDGASYTSEPELFLESSGDTGFAPSDVAVGWDGSLYIATGGRHSRGAVYRVDYVRDGLATELATNWLVLANSDLEAAVDAPQPLDEWSRRIWMALAERLGPGPFATLAADARGFVPRRVRAIEILTEMHGGLPAGIAQICAQDNSADIRARTAWSQSVRPGVNAATILTGLARDNTPAVRCAALIALRDLATELPVAVWQPAVGLNLAHPDRRVRQAAVLLATWLPELAWNGLAAQQTAQSVPTRNSLLLAHLWRSPPTAAADTRAIELTLGALKQERTIEAQIDCMRLLILAMGDGRLQSPSAEVFAGYEPAFGIADPSLSARVEQAVSPLWTSGSRTLNVEATRVLAMIEAKNTGLPARLLGAIGPQTDPGWDFHLLAVVARLGAIVPTNVLDRAARAIVGLDRKQPGQGRGRNWPARLQELGQRLCERNPGLAAAILRQPELVRPGNLPLVPSLGAAHRTACARLFAAAVQRSSGYPWSIELIDLLAGLPPNEVSALFRRQWSNGTLRERLILALAGQPLAEDRPHLIAGLRSFDSKVVRSAAEGLIKLSRDNSSVASAVVGALRALRRFGVRPDDRETRAILFTLVNHLMGEKLALPQEGRSPFDAYEPMFAWVGQKLPGALPQTDFDDLESQAKWSQFLKNVPWARGDAARGFALYRDLGCVRCHDGQGAPGPDLAGITNRLAVRELFHAILYPSREIAEPWRMETFRLRNGQTYTGRVTFESDEILLLQPALATTVRLDAAQIASREPSPQSFMPGGLLSGLSTESFADLYAWLKAMGAP